MKMSTGNNPNEHLNICCTQQIQLIEDWSTHQIPGGNKSSLQFPDSHLPSLENQNASRINFLGTPFEVHTLQVSMIFAPLARIISFCKLPCTPTQALFCIMTVVFIQNLIWVIWDLMFGDWYWWWYGDWYQSTDKREFRPKWTAAARQQHNCGNQLVTYHMTKVQCIYTWHANWTTLIDWGSKLPQ
jgi:hypothetical protein